MKKFIIKNKKVDHFPDNKFNNIEKDSSNNPSPVFNIIHIVVIVILIAGLTNIFKHESGIVLAMIILSNYNCNYGICELLKKF